VLPWVQPCRSTSSVLSCCPIAGDGNFHQQQEAPLLIRAELADNHRCLGRTRGHSSWSSLNNLNNPPYEKLAGQDTALGAA
jgi:hypothetical protein